MVSQEQGIELHVLINPEDQITIVENMIELLRSGHTHFICHAYGSAVHNSNILNEFMNEEFPELYNYIMEIGAKNWLKLNIQVPYTFGDAFMSIDKRERIYLLKIFLKELNCKQINLNQ